MKIDGLGEYGLDFHEDVESLDEDEDEEEYGSEAEDRAEGGQQMAQQQQRMPQNPIQQYDYMNNLPNMSMDEVIGGLNPG